MDEDELTYKVVYNEELQYSIWPAHRAAPQGWTEEGVSGPKQACLDHITGVWTDLRPLSLRRAMAAAEHGAS